MAQPRTSSPIEVAHREGGDVVGDGVDDTSELVS